MKKQIVYSPGIDIAALHAALPSDALEVACIRTPDDIPDGDALQIVLATPDWLLQHQGHDKLCGDASAGACRLVLAVAGIGLESDALVDERVDDVLLVPAPPLLWRKKIRSAFLRLNERRMAAQLQLRLDERSHELHQVASIGAMLMSEKDYDRLLQLILLKARELTAADAGSLYLVERPEGDTPHLRFKLSQNDSLALSFSEFTLPLSESSIAGWVAVNRRVLNLADVYAIDAGQPFKFNKDFDARIGYRTRSMLTLPLLNHEDDIIGVLQLINRKRSFDTRLHPQNVPDEVIEFDDHAIDLVNALAGGAAVSIENNLLYQSIERLFEGFVQASVTAIESRDPTTAGHSGRVADLTCRLAEVVSGAACGSLAAVSFSADQLKEIRYASLLHDFGKVGVREAVLLKANKLYAHTYQDICRRLFYWKKTVENQALQRKIEILESGGVRKEQAFRDIEMDMRRQLEKIDAYLQAVTVANEPAVLESDKMAIIDELAKEKFFDAGDHERPLLQQPEYEALIIRRGSLDEVERREIESHVTHTFRFLKEVPWTRDLSRIPDIAHGHHEKLNGAGYPRGISADSIPFQSRMMTICDIFDALTAADRPYKRAVPVSRALHILELEVKDQHVDPELVRLFIDARVFESVGKQLD